MKANKQCFRTVSFLVPCKSDLKQLGTKKDYFVYDVVTFLP